MTKNSELPTGATARREEDQRERSDTVVVMGEDTEGEEVDTEATPMTVWGRVFIK